MGRDQIARQDRTDARGCTGIDQVASFQCDLLRQLRDHFRNIPDHLADIAALTFGAGSYTIAGGIYNAGGSTLSVADLNNRKTHQANHNACPLKQILADFRLARLVLVTRLGTLESNLFARSMLHPRLKQPMRLVDHLYFVAEHDDHHLAHIWELIHRESGDPPPTSLG